MSIGREKELLLRAALSGGASAIDAWHAWRATIDLDDVDWASMRLVPLLWHNLLAQGVDDPLLGRYRAVYRHTWLSNQVRVRRLRAIEAVLAAEGVEMVVLKGVALAHGYYATAGLRPMDDLDVLVRPADVPAAVAALLDAGWTSGHRRPARVMSVVHGQEFRDPAGERLDLHGHVFQGSLHPGLEEQRWRRAELLTLPDGRLRVLDPTDQLLHVLVHGAESDPPAPRWVADAVMVLRRRGGEIDWPRLLAEAQAESRLLAVTDALAQLAALLPETATGAPRRALADLRGRRSTRAERLEHRVAAGWRLFAVRHLVERYVDHRRWQRADPQQRATTGFAAYLRLNWDLDGFGQLPGQVLNRGLRTFVRDARAGLARLRTAARPRSRRPTWTRTGQR